MCFVHLMYRQSTHFGFMKMMFTENLLLQSIQYNLRKDLDNITIFHMSAL